jgi:hypothetical protein
VGRHEAARAGVAGELDREELGGRVGEAVGVVDDQGAAGGGEGEDAERGVMERLARDVAAGAGADEDEVEALEVRERGGGGAEGGDQ